MRVRKARELIYNERVRPIAPSTAAILLSLSLSACGGDIGGAGNGGADAGPDIDPNADASSCASVQVDLSEQIAAGPVPQYAQNAYLAVANDRGLDWVGLWREYTEANYLSGERHTVGRGFAEGAAYPTSAIVSIDSLPQAYRTVLVLRDIEELSTREAAQMLGISEGAVKTRLHRARFALKARMEQELGPDVARTQE